MSKPVRGANRIVLVRPYALRTQKEAGRLMFQTNHEISRTRDSESTITKDGNIQSVSEIVVEMSLTTLMAHGDPVRTALEAAFRDGGLVEFWDINKTEPVDGLDANGTGQFPSVYYQGYITEWSESAGAEDSVEISISAAINGAGVEGPATLTPEQSEALVYDFADTTQA